MTQEFKTLFDLYVRRSGLTNAELARITGFAFDSSISNMRNGRRGPTRRPMLISIGHAMSLSTVELNNLLIAARYSPVGLTRWTPELQELLERTSKEDAHAS